jgi:hypothetical protein
VAGAELYRRIRGAGGRRDPGVHVARRC